MQRIISIKGPKPQIAELLLDLAARIQLHTHVIFIDPGKVFNPQEVIERSGHINNITVTYPTSAYKLRALVDNKIRRIIEATFSGFIIISSISELFSQVDNTELPRVVDYVYDQLERLCEEYEITAIIGCTNYNAFIEKKAAILADIAIDLNTLSKETNSF